MKGGALLCLLLFLATACAAQTSGTDSIGGSISGVVRDAGTGAPVAEAFVSLRIGNSGEVAVSQSDAQGQYTLTGIPVGTYTVYASAPPERDPTMTPNGLSATP